MGDRDSDTVRGIRQLCDWAACVELRDIPHAVLQRGARVLVDDLAAIIGARDEPEVAAFHASLLERAAREEATLFCGGRRRIDCLSAAVGNGTAGDFLELDEGYRVAPCHAGLYIVPALLATAEFGNLVLGDLLRALVVAYEIVTRVARTWPPRVMNLHSHARYSAVGAAAATALAGRTSADLLHRALTAAATLVNNGPRNHLVSGALVRNVWPAVGAWSGMMSVEWARCGIGGSPQGFDDVYTGLLGSEAQPQHLLGDLGGRWAVLDGYLKIHACCQHLHSTVEATLDLRSRVIAGGGMERIERIDVAAHPLALLLPNAHPATTLGAKFSLPHAVAAALVTGSGGAHAFASSTLDDPAIARLRERVTMAPYGKTLAPPNDRPARVSVHLSGGQVVDAECLSAQGGADRPFPPEVFVEKIAELTSPVYPRYVAVSSELLRLDPGPMQQGWRDIVGDLCAG